MKPLPPLHPLLGMIDDLLPLEAEGPEWEAFVDDIDLHNVRDPLTTFQGKLVKGRRRRLAIERLRARGKDPTFSVEEWDGKGSLISLLWSSDVFRRHLTPSQRAMLAARQWDLVEEEIKRRSIPDPYLGADFKPKSNTQFRKEFEDDEEVSNGKGANLHPSKTNGKTAKAVAKAAGVSLRTAKDATKVNAKGSKKLVDAVTSGKMKVYKAARLADLTADQQTEAIQDEQAEAHRVVAQSEFRRWLGRLGQLLETATTALDKADTVAREREGDKRLAPTLKHLQRTRDALAEYAAARLAEAKG